MKEQGMFLNRLGDMLQNGFSMGDAIGFLGRMDQRGSSFTQAMLKKLQEGIPIHEILSEEQFDKKACAQIFFADKHGNIAIALKEAGMYLIKRDNERKMMMKLLQYPLVLIGILILILFLLKNLLLSQFTDLYSSMDYHPSPLIRFFTQLMEKGPLLLSIFCVIVFLVFLFSCLYFSKNTPVKNAEWIARIPAVRFYFRLFNSQFLARECSFLLQSGFSINEVLACIASQHYRPLVKNTAELIRKDLTLGYSFSNSLSKFSFYDPQLIMVIQHGEKNGRLDQELQFYSRFCLGQIEEKMEKVFKIIQPVMFFIIGLLVLAVYLSIMLPMFDMMDSI
ncbi:competence type IV pilus assembly protein ComGB [Margalitia sp. FSL K6-0131]|uniref:competence type IV pilus assembly protein ComGB n=1 Tax=Margalitia sp. FSL K6-0131 TaxID=2954604 RepID=UPI0030F92657